MLVDMTESDLQEQRQELVLCDAMVSEMQSDLGISPFDEMCQDVY
jgi:hypothetical protein